MFTSPPVMLARYRLDGSILAATNQAERVKRTIHCLKRLRPDWEGNVLTKDVISHIGRKAAEGHIDYNINDAITIRFEIQIQCGVDCKLDASGFDKIEGEYIEDIEYDVHVVSFLWWRSDAETEFTQLRQMGTSLENMFPEELLACPNGVDIDAQFDEHRFNQKSIVRYMLEHINTYSEHKEITFVRWFANDAQDED